MVVSPYSPVNGYSNTLKSHLNRHNTAKLVVTYKINFHYNIQCYKKTKCFLIEDYSGVVKKQSRTTVQVQCNHSPCPLPLFLTTAFGKNTRTTLKRQIIASYFPTSTTPLVLFFKIKISVVSRYHISKNNSENFPKETHFRLLHHPSTLREPKASECFPLITVHPIPDTCINRGNFLPGRSLLAKAFEGLRLLN